MADPTTVTNKKTTFDADTNPDFVVWTDEVTDAATLQKKQLVGLVDATADSIERIPGTAANGLKVDPTRVSLAAAIQVTVTGSIGDLIAANANRRGLIFRALSANTQSIFYGPAGVTLTTGMEVKPGEIVSFLPGEVPTNLIRALSTSGSQIVIVQEST